MIVRMSIFRKRDDLGQEAFSHYWRDIHAPIALKIPGLQKYEQNHVVVAVDSVPALARNHAPDGICQLLFRDASEMQGVFTPEMKKILMADEAKFIQELRTFVVQQNVVLAPREGPATKCLSLISRRKDMSSEDFNHRWRGDYAQQIAKIPGVRAYRQSFVTDRTIDRIPATYEQLPIDCIDELWVEGASEMDSVRQIREAATQFASAMDSSIVDVHAP